ncbi:putative U4/U6.U5 small nuclear ribonucleoprotein 27kDa protein [Plasmopara halstedii]
MYSFVTVWTYRIYLLIQMRSRSRSRSRSGSLDSLGRRRRRKTSSNSRRRRRSVSTSRSRSRSPSYGHRRRHRTHNRSHGRSRSRRRRSYSRSRSTSQSPIRRRRSPSHSAPRETKESVDVEPKEIVGQPNAISQLSEEEQMKLLLGFQGFDSTKGKEVDENAKSAAVGTARRETKREYRQYMNRRGGFNRPLDKS